MQWKIQRKNEYDRECPQPGFNKNFQEIKKPHQNYIPIRIKITDPRTGKRERREHTLGSATPGQGQGGRRRWRSGTADGIGDKRMEAEDEHGDGGRRAGDAVD